MKYIVSIFILLVVALTQLHANTLNTENNLNLTQQEIEYINKKQTIYVANELDWVPFDYYEDNVPKGYIVDYIKIATKKVGLEPIFITKKWTNLIEDFKNKKIDLLPVVSYNTKREEYLNFTKPHVKQNLSITVKENRNDIISIDDLKDKKVGMIKGWNLTNILKKEYTKLNIIEFDSLTDIFDAIENGFIDATIQNNTLTNYYINKNYYGVLKSNINITLKEFDTNLYMGVRKDLTVLHEILNKAISSMTKEELELLKNKWIKPVNTIEFTKEEKKFIENTTINITTGSGWAPFTFVDNSTLHGISIDFWKYIEKKSGLKSKIDTKYVFSDIIDSFKEKKSDIILSTSKTPDKEKLGIFTNQYMQAPIGIATSMDTQYIGNVKEILNKKIAVGKNFSAHQLMKEKYPNMQFVFVNGVKEGLDYVSNNKAYAYIDIMPVLTYSIEKHSYTNIKISGQADVNFQLVSMIRSDYPLLKSIIDKTMRNMSYEEKEKILNRWFKAKFEKDFDYSLLWKVVLVFMVILFFILYKHTQLQRYQKKLEKAQKETENSLENFKTLMNLNIAGIIIFKESQILYANDEIVTILAFTHKSKLMKTNIDLILQANDIKNIKANESYETKAQKENGQFIPILLRANSIVFENVEATILSIVDLSDLKNKEEIILQQSKMASLGEMIGNIAHQWRQPLSYISTAASGMKMQKQFGQLDDKELVKLLDGITDTTMFLSQTIDDFRDYIKGEKVKKEFHIEHSINSVLSLMHGTFINCYIEVETNIDDVRVIGFENELNQVLLNLLTNSKDALQEIEQKNRKIFINSYQKNHELIIEVIDSGGGIKEDIIKKVFEPYFSTKHQSQGTGLGLYMTHNIIHNSMNGEITIENVAYNQYKKCTQITIKLPL